MERILLLVDDLTNCGPTFQAWQVFRSLMAEPTVRLINLCRPNGSTFPTTSIPNASSDVSDLPVRNSFDLGAAKSLSTAINEFRPGVVHCWGNRAYQLARVAIPAAMRTRLFVSDFETRRTPSLQSWLPWPRSHQVTRIVPHRSLTSKKSVAGEGSVVIPWGGFAEQTNHQTAKPRDEICKRLDVPTDSKLAVTIGRLRPPARVKDFIWACELMSCVRDDVYWLIVGDGIQRWRLEKYASQLTCLDRLRFLSWHPDAAEIVRHANAYVQTSSADHDFCGMMCAMQSGVPVVAVVDELCQALIKSGESGYLVERGARNEIARCVNRLIDHPELGSRFGTAGQRHLKRHYSLDGFLDQLTRLYHRGAGVNQPRVSA